MAHFTENEEILLKNIIEPKLHTSLSLIRTAAEDIWASDAPRIIHDYTDHGMPHSESLSKIAVEILNANDGRPFSEKEMYLLLAGIYLHDIGMQCDAVKFPGIKEKCEELGAEFDLSFNSQTSSTYSVEEQKAIRNNHHLLSAAWIDYAFRTGETSLGPAIKNVSSDLITDLMDVCKFHSKLPITNCSQTFNFHPNERKQLVAATLRLSDELDITSNRVSISTVFNFSLNKNNAVYWWLHNLTNISISGRNIITMGIRLNPKDKEKYGHIIQQCINDFRTKNRPVLGVLSQNGIPMAISADSDVVEDEYAPPLPPEIVDALHFMLRKPDPVILLSNEVCTWLQAMRYEVSPPQKHSDHCADMIALIDQGAVKARILIRCIDGEIMPVDVERLGAMLDRHTPAGWLISDKRVSDRARELAAKDDLLQVFNLSDFLRQKVWGPYFDALTSLVERDRISELYVDLGCFKLEVDEKGKETGRDKHKSLDSYLDDWLAERGKMHISVLGEFGSGKTWCCRHYTYRRLQTYLEDPVNERLPILITLRDFTKSLTVQQLINGAFLEQYKLPFVGSAFDIFQELNRRGKLVLILDGFDEMARQVDYQTVVDNFWELAKLADVNSKVILTSRTEYFRWGKESEKILEGREFGRRTIVLSPPKFEVIYLQPFSDPQIREVITRRIGKEKGPVVADSILGRPNLAGMARKPVLVELLLAALTEVSPDVLENPAQVYLYATNKLLLRNIETKRTFTRTADKLFFLCELAWEMIKTGEMRIHYTSIPDRIKNYFGDRIKDQHELDTWDSDLRSQTLLHRDAAGYYEFAHKSLAEYFVAFKFAAEIGSLPRLFKETYCEADCKPCQIPIPEKNVTELAATFGMIKLNDRRLHAVTNLLNEIIKKDASKKLWKIINETKGKSIEQVRYTGGNAVTLLKFKGASFKHSDFSNKNLAGADLSFSSIVEANFNKCDMSESDLYGALFDKETFKGAIFKDSKLLIIAQMPPNIKTDKYSNKMFKPIIVTLHKTDINLIGVGSTTDNSGNIVSIFLICSINNIISVHTTMNILNKKGIKTFIFEKDISKYIKEGSSYTLIGDFDIIDIDFKTRGRFLTPIRARIRFEHESGHIIARKSFLNDKQLE